MPSIRTGTMLRAEDAPTIPHMTSPFRGFRFLDWTLPARDAQLARTGHGQRIGRRLARDRAPAADRRAAPDPDRRDQHAIRSDARFVVDDGAMLVRAVVICRDRSRAEV